MYKIRSRNIQKNIELNDGWDRTDRFKEAKFLEVGSIERGKVIKLFFHGAIIAIFNIRTYLHVSEIMDKYLDEPAKVLSLNQIVYVKILTNEIDKKGRLSIKVSMKGVDQTHRSNKPAK